MGLFDAIDIAGSGMTAERLRMDLTSENLANAQTTRTANGQPYQRQEAILTQIPGAGFGATLAGALGISQPASVNSATSLPTNVGGDGTASGQTPGGVQVSQIVSDPTPGPLVYDPGSPDANAQGYVRMPNVNTVTEMTDLIDESNSYQADVTAMQTAKAMFSATLQVLK